MAKTYRTIQRDAFDAIAYRKWQDSHLGCKIMAENVEYMDVLFFDPGVELKLPEISQKKKTGKLPPWYGVNND